jgi:phosphate transport system permease protein
MTGIPTVVYSFVALFLLVPVIREFFQSGSGLCILSASIMLSILIAPTMILIFVSGFNSVPRSYIQAIDAMGGGPVHRLFYVIIPCSKNAVIIGTMLGFGRAMGDTLIPLMLAGNAVHIPGSVLDSARTLTAHIALVSASDFDSLEFRSIFASGLVLYILIAGIVAVIQGKVMARERLTT